jgi:hypothetical protein
MAPVAVVIIAGHLAVPYLFRHAAASAAIASGVLAVLIVKHLGMAAVLSRSLGRRFRRRKP